MWPPMNPRNLKSFNLRNIADWNHQHLSSKKTHQSQKKIRFFPKPAQQGCLVPKLSRTLPNRDLRAKRGLTVPSHQQNPLRSLLKNIIIKTRISPPWMMVWSPKAWTNWAKKAWPGRQSSVVLRFSTSKNTKWHLASRRAEPLKWSVRAKSLSPERMKMDNR